MTNKPRSGLRAVLDFWLFAAGMLAMTAALGLFLMWPTLYLMIFKGMRGEDAVPGWAIAYTLVALPVFISVIVYRNGKRQ